MLQWQTSKYASHKNSKLQNTVHRKYNIITFWTMYKIGQGKYHYFQYDLLKIREVLEELW